MGETRAVSFLLLTKREGKLLFESIDTEVMLFATKDSLVRLKYLATPYPGTHAAHTQKHYKSTDSFPPPYPSFSQHFYPRLLLLPKFSSRPLELTSAILME